MPAPTPLHTIDSLGLAPILEQVDVVSFDIFDTLVERLLEPPEQIKRLAARFMRRFDDATFAAPSADELLALRAAVECALRRGRVWSGFDQECRFSDLAAELSLRLTGTRTANALSAEVSRRLIESELAAEARALIVRPGIAALLSELAARGKRLIAVSDMYLDGWMVKRLLVALGIGAHFRAVYVSSDFGLGKHSGRLFQRVFECEHVAPSRFVHIGDTHGSDYLVPKSLGATAIHLPHASAARSEVSRLYSVLGERNAFWRGEHFLAGISAAASSDFFFRYGHDVLGPIFATFIAGLREALIDERQERVFFVAREGDLFRRIYELFQDPALGLPPAPEAGYLFMSRKTVASPAAHQGLSAEQIRVLLPSLEHSGLAALAATLGIDRALLTGVAQRLGLPSVDAGVSRQRIDWVAKLSADSALQTSVRAAAREPRLLLRRYLSEQGFLGSGRKIALADIGWSGTIQRWLQDAFEHDPQWPKLTAYYLSYNDLRGHELAADSVRGIVFDCRRHHPAHASFVQFEELFENGARALHATTVGYVARPDGTVAPLLQDEQAATRVAERKFDPMTERLREGALEFSRKFAQRYSLLGYDAEDLLPRVHELARRAILFPTRSEVQQLTQLVHSEDLGTASVMNFEEYRTGQLGAWLRPRQLYRTLRRSNWKYGSARSLGIPGLNHVLRFTHLQLLERSRQRSGRAKANTLPRAKLWESAFVRLARASDPALSRALRKVLLRRR